MSLCFAPCCVVVVCLFLFPLSHLLLLFPLHRKPLSHFCVISCPKCASTPNKIARHTASENSRRHKLEHHVSKHMKKQMVNNSEFSIWAPQETHTCQSGTQHTSLKTSPRGPAACPAAAARHRGPGPQSGAGWRKVPCEHEISLHAA